MKLSLDTYELITYLLIKASREGDLIYTKKEIQEALQEVDAIGAY